MGNTKGGDDNKSWVMHMPLTGRHSCVLVYPVLATKLEQKINCLKFIVRNVINS